MRLEHVSWFIIVGALLVLMAAGGSLLKRLPVSTAMVCLAMGVALGHLGAELVRLDPVRDAEFLERLTEVAVIVSLFTAGFKLRLPLRDRRWLVPLRLAVVSMALTVGLIAVAGNLVLGLP